MKTVRDLMNVLATVPQDMPVILQKDAKGNGYSPVAGADIVWYDAETPYSGDVSRGGAPTDESIRAVVLYPIN